MATGPIASQKRLAELGLDKADYGSCSKPIQESVRNRGRTWINRGCNQWEGCPYRESTQFMQPRDATDTEPRPRNVITKFIKPSSSGPGDRVIDGYCSCFQFLGGLKRRDGRNSEIAEAVGGEGEIVKITSSEKKTNTDGSVYFRPIKLEVTVPRFPDPTEVDELFEDVHAGQSRIEHKARTVDAERERRLTGSVAKQEASEARDVTIVDLGRSGGS